MVGGLAQSGYYSPYSEVDSVLEMEVEFVQDGSVSFNYALVPFSSSSKLFFFFFGYFFFSFSQNKTFPPSPLSYPQPHYPRPPWLLILY